MRKSRPLKRRIHTAFHHSMMRLLTRLLKRTRESDLQKLSSNLPLRSLFIRYERIGDLLMATPAIRAIAESREGSTVDVLASPANAAVVEGNPRVRRIVLFSRPAWSTYPALWWRLRRARYDVVIDGRVNPQRITGITPLLLLMTGARIRIGAAIEGKESLYTHRVPVDRYAHFARQTLSLARPFGVDVDAVDLRPEIYVTSAESARAKGLWAKLVSDDASPRLIVNISAVGPLRQWPDERYAYVVRGFLGRYPKATVVIVATPSEANRAKLIASASEATYVATSLRELLALVATADLVFTPDTAVSHIASAFPTRAVVLLPSLPEAPDVLSPDGSIPWQTPGRLVRSPIPSLTGIPASDALDQLLDAMMEAEQLT